MFFVNTVHIFEAFKLVNKVPTVWIRITPLSHPSHKCQPVTVPTLWSVRDCVRSESKPFVDSSQCEIRIQTVGSVYHAHDICHVESLIPVLLVESLDFSFTLWPHSRGAVMRSDIFFGCTE